ncbi:tyrosine-type recombinase/integrase [Thiomicrorhabdus sediminis]|uniref:Site-specific integrase n=1 Tax=Thiomicrorhabdus sediminis TaxID=2580412 RepID=A0A4P9K4E8_9GAMM|nr:site-specific integrase [Thiomicrorhabdus sediminis]QCU89591.1 site-specific integrase [Thiomicrorhabdus sediminis]
MSLYLRNNVWWTRFISPDGTVVQRSTKTDNRRQAQEYMDLLKADLWRVQFLGEKPRMLWQEAVVRFMRETQNKDRDSEVRMFRYFDKYFRDKYVDEIRRMHVDEIIQDKLKDGVANATVNRYLQKLRAVLNKAHKEWEVKCSPPYIKLLKEPKKRVRWITETEANKLLRLLPSHLADMVAFALETGLRESNITLLRWDQVDLSQKVIFIEGDDILKSEKAFVVPLSEMAVSIIRRQIGKHRERVFTYQGKGIRRANTYAFKNAVKAAGLDNFRFHDLRHTWATWHVQRGTPIEILQELGGWSDYKMVKRYAHFSHDHLKQYVDRSQSALTTKLSTVTTLSDFRK